MDCWPEQAQQWRGCMPVQTGAWHSKLWLCGVGMCTSIEQMGPRAGGWGLISRYARQV
jgi:hypothetical protein